ncbi:MAG: helix-turn-helix transcriptional regulator [Bacteroidetes bacterium]|nr:helix-turn-helix transcriptional regulator [Bacteroidota bacterium]
MNIKRIIGDNIRGYRNRLDWSQEKLAVRAKMHNDYLGRLERGVQNASIDSLFKIAKALGVAPYKLWIEDSYKREK